MRIKLEEQREKTKVAVVVILLFIACMLTYYCHAILKTESVFTQFFYIPIILASLWWQKRGVVVAIFLSAMLIASYVFIRVDVETANDFFRVPIFIVVSIVVALLSERIKEREVRLGESEQRFRSLIEKSLTGFSIIQDDGVIYQNPEQERLLGPLPRPPQLEDLKSIHPDDLEKVKDFSRRITSKDFQTLDIDFRFYSGDKSSDKTSMRWLNCRAIEIEYQGKEAILVNTIDITKTKEMEHLLRIQDKMISLGRVAAGIAHEIRNPLSGINVYLNTLHNIYDKGESLDKVKRIIEQLQSASRKIESVIKRVMDFSKPIIPKLALSDINRSIEEAYKLSSVTLRKSGIAIGTCLDENLPLILADTRMIEEVILNLITNAAEALKHVEGTKSIEIASSVQDNSLLIKVADSGLGVPKNIRSHIFDPFYTTKDDGTGIGLSISHRIIADHGGSLSMSVSKWGGAEFIVKLPVKKE